MHFTLNMSNNFKPSVVLTHGKQELTFTVSPYAKDTIDQGFDIFDQINAFWAQLEHFRIDQIFAIFQQIFHAFDDPDMKERALLTVRLQELVGQLFAYHPMAEVRHWILFKSKSIRIPDGLSHDYVVNNDLPGSRDQTYLREEYVDLVTYAMLVRMMFPIWGEYLARTRLDYGTTFKEYYAYDLLLRTELRYCAAAQKLRLYIESNSPPEAPPSATLGGISSEDYPMWILALVVTRRVCIGDLRGLEDKAPKLVKYIYNYIVQKIQGSETNFGGMGKVTPKPMEMSGGDDEDSNGSRYETYKIREEITIGDRVFLSHGLRNIPETVQHIAPGVDEHMLMRALQTSNELTTVPILNVGQQTLARWIFRAVISPRAFDYFTRPLEVRLLAASQCILWHWGYKDLAMLATAKPVHDRLNRTVRVGAVDIKKYMPELAQLYPYPRRTNRQNRDNTNQVLGAFDLMADHLNSNDWSTTIDSSLLAELNQDSNSRLFVTPANIKARLAQLVTDHVSKLSRNNPNSILPGSNFSAV